MEVHSLTVGLVQENCYVLRRDGADDAIVIDPGEEPDRILGVIQDAGVRVAAILVTHCHFDHIGAVAPVAKATGAEVWVPRIERPLLEDIMAFIPWDDFGPYDSYSAEHDVEGGERLELAGFVIDVISTPGHSPGHVSYSIADQAALFSGDVLFQGSIGRTDLPGGDMNLLMRSISRLLETLPGETNVYPGHMGVTTLAAEAATNPFLGPLSHR